MVILRLFDGTTHNSSHSQPLDPLLRIGIMNDMNHKYWVAAEYFLHLKLSLYCPILGVGASFPLQDIWLLYEHNDWISPIAKDELNAIRFLHTIEYKRNPIKLDLLDSKSISLRRESCGLWHQNVKKYYRLVYLSSGLVCF